MGRDPTAPLHSAMASGYPLQSFLCHAGLCLSVDRESKHKKGFSLLSLTHFKVESSTRPQRGQIAVTRIRFTTKPTSEKSYSPPTSHFPHPTSHIQLPTRKLPSILHLYAIYDITCCTSGHNSRKES